MGWLVGPGVLLGISIGLAGCAIRPATDLDSLTASFPELVELTDVPFFPQKVHHCAPAALATVLNWSGVTVTPDALAPEVYLPARRGSLPIELLGATRRYARVPYVLAPRMEALFAEVAAGQPVIVLQNLAFAWYPRWHYAVVVGFDRGQIILRSGTTRRHVLSLAAFARTWALSSHWALVVAQPARVPHTAEENPYLDAVLGLERVGQWNAAAAAYDAALTRWPSSLAARLGLGNSRYALKDLPGAQATFRAATLAHPNAGDAFNNLAHVLSEQGLWTEARAAAQRAVDIGGIHVEIYRQTLTTIDTNRPR